MPKRHSPLDEPLAQEASELVGFEVTRTQIEDWREAQILEVTRSGSRPGQYSYAYVPGSPDLAACLARCLRDAREEGRIATLDQATLVCFVRGHRPREVGLRRAYERVYATLGVTPDGGIVSPRDAAKLLSRRASTHPLTRALKAHVERPGDLFSVIENLAAATLGNASELKPQTTAAIFGAFGASEDAIAQAIEHANTPGPSMVERAYAVRSASFEELMEAREFATVSVAVGRRMMELFASELGFHVMIPEGLSDIWNDLSTAVAWVPHVLIRRREIGREEYDATMRTLPGLIEQEFPQLSAET